MHIRFGAYFGNLSVVAHVVGIKKLNKIDMAIYNICIYIYICICVHIHTHTHTCASSGASRLRPMHHLS